MSYLGDVTWHFMTEHLLPSYMQAPKMAEVSYTDLNKYVIIHMSKWVDPKSKKIHRVEYRAQKLPPGVDLKESYEMKILEKWQDGRFVETLSAYQLSILMEDWPFHPEPVMLMRVLRERPRYNVLVQWKINEGDGIHLMEIIKYDMESSFRLRRDGETIFHTMTSSTYAKEEETMNSWLKAKGDRKPGVWDTIRNWKFFGAHENIRSLLVELEALGGNDPEPARI